ncbi:zinc finger protein 398-like [Pleurodeles waltl]|uniref:zinc finger protein 398-like n=1 Tax=Pleurodeles waltl TaxID=8319 RepID=UPI00370955C2
MSERPSEEGQVKFRDVSVCFSEEEWKTLYQWQKDFYQNVIKEIHQALFLMGYQIVHPDNLLQVYRGKDSYVPVSRAGEHTELQEPGSSSLPEVIPDVLFRISHKEESDCGERQHSDEAGSCNSASSCFPVVTAAFSLTKEQELQLYPALQQNLQRREKSDHPSTGFPVWESAVSLENEDKSARFLKGFPGAGEEGHAETRAGRKAVPEVVAADIKEEEKEVSFSQQQDCRVIDVSGAEGGERVNSLKKVGEPLTCCKTEASEKAFLKREHPNMFQSSYEGSRSPLWSDNCLENRGGQVAQFERDTSHTEYIGEDQEIAKVLMSPKENENECDRWNSKIINGLLYLTKKKALHNPSEYNQNNSPQSKCASNLAKLPPVRAFPCSDCEKSFFKMPQLVQHYRTHTGERPYACSFCDKTYNRSYHLKDHIRTHTGERPHMCLVCQQTFTYKSHFNSHRRKKKHYLWDAN